MSSTALKVKEESRIYSLQILRGIAALMVVFHHIKGYTNIVGENTKTIYNIIPEIFGFGAPLFFVISGFLMAYLLENNHHNFLIRRLIRIYPPFIIAATLIILLKAIIFGNVAYNNLFYALTLLPFGSTPTYPLGIEWTLIYEVFFYIVCAFFATKHMKKLFMPFLIVWSILITVGIYAFNAPTEYLSTLKQIPLSTLNYLFIFGAFAYYATRFKLVVPKKVNSLLIGANVIIILFVYYKIIGKTMTAYNLRFLIFGVLFGLLVYLIANIKIKPSNILVHFGDYSYGIYLIHAQLMFILLTVWKDELHLPITWISSTFTLILTLIISWYFGKFEFTLHKKTRTFKPPTLDLKKLAVPSFVALTLFSLCFAQYMISAKPTEEKAIHFDPSKIDSRNTSAGWVDSVSSYDASKNHNITITGWAIDPYNKKPASSVLLVSGNQSIPAKLTWSERTGIAQLLNTNDVLMSGFTIEFNSDDLGAKTSNIEIYALTVDGKYIALLTKQPIVISLAKE